MLAGGREQDWDLDGKHRALLARAEALVLADEIRLPFAELARWQDLTAWPGWLADGTTWSLLTACGQPPGGAGWSLPARQRRSLWQARPEALWMPAPVATDDPGWQVDPFLREGQPTLPPPPAPEVPRYILAGLKQLFDPEHRLPSPDWLPRTEP